MTPVSPELSDEQLKIVERVQKILALADRNPNQAEAAAAAGKAQELLDALSPDYISRLIDKAVAGVRDAGKWDAALQREAEDKRVLAR